MTSKNFQSNMVDQNHEIIFEVVKVSGNWAFPAAKSIVEATKGKNMYLRLTDDGRSDIFRLDSVKDGENAGETVFGFVGNGGMDLVELTATTDGAGTTTGSWDYEPGEGPAGEAIGNLGHPLQWKGPATVSELNDGIEGIQPGWTYTLTDAGTLTYGSVKVDVGDEVAWTEDGDWFKLGGEGVAKVYTVTYDSETTTWNYPTYSQISTDVAAGKFVVLLVTNPAGAVYSYKLDDKTLGLDSSFRFSLFTKEVTRTISIKNDDTVTEGTIWNDSVENIAPDYSDLTFPIAEGTQCSHNGKYYYCSLSGGIQSSEPWTVLHWTQTSVAAQIGNVEALLAAL